ncbi:MAG: hypothetical protein HYT81_05010, partial [Gemmatimonadetes bacterium]|nr:hypothetical protein [Gemmatimonadota bacterium]
MPMPWRYQGDPLADERRDDVDRELVHLPRVEERPDVTPGALVQRFGSKRKLMLRLYQGMADWTTGMFAQLRAANRSPLAALR